MLMSRVHYPATAAWNGLLSRRDLLRVGSLGIAASIAPMSFTTTARAAPSKLSTQSKAKSVILLWMSGGVTHIDSFDPKPEAPQEIRGP
jgi:hypothetical protein